jgi:hypothetical protein
MELSTSVAHQLSPSTSLFIYGGLPGEPAFGPPAFMHRQSIADSPEAPISHHWLDSTHVTFGVLTAGLIVDTWKIEVSGFKGREPDQYRFDIEAPALNSLSTRLSWNPTPALSLQVSYADQKAPEQLEPTGRVSRVSASAIYTVPMGDQGWWSTTMAWGQKAPTDGPALDAFALESAIHPDADWTVFGRIETIQSTELGGHSDHAHGQRFSKLSAGVIRDFTVSDHATLGFGVLHAFNKVPVSLAKDYGSDTPQGDMVFLRLKII